MEIEEQVLSIEQMNHLKELGVVVKDTAIVWDSDEQGWASANLSNTFFDEDLKDCVPTLTLEEILEMLPKEIVNKDSLERCYFSINYDRSDGSFDVSYVTKDNPRCINFYYSENLKTAAYNMLCWCAENGYLNASNSMPLNKE